MLQIGILFALLSALTANLGFLYKHRGANEKPSVDIFHPVRTGLELWKSKAFALGMMVGLIGWLCHTIALSLAPISVIQVVLAGGIVLVAVLADRFFGIDVGRRQWVGLILTGLGLALLVVAMPAAKDIGENGGFRVMNLAALEGGLLAIGVALVVAGHDQRFQRFHGPLLGAAAGVFFGVCNVAVKATTGVLAVDGSILTPWAFLALAASAAGYFISAKSLQEGGAVEVIAITATAANIIGIGAGFIVFGDPVANSLFGQVVQGLAFLMVVLAAAMLPAPRSVTELPDPKLAPDPVLASRPVS